MGLSKKVKAFFVGDEVLVNEGLGFESSLENIKLLAKACEPLKSIISDYENGTISQEQFIAKSIACLAKDFIQLREYKDSMDLQW
ncbi:TPA: hypothetical protein QHN64_000692 [Klebsiella aerogenes]|nr:hypothetical protein [Klebsiella aerogenes]